MEFLSLSKLLAKNIETLSQRQKMEETFSTSHDMTEDMSSYWKWGKLLRKQDFSGDMDNY